MKIAFQLDDVFENNIEKMSKTKQNSRNEDVGERKEKLKTTIKTIVGVEGKFVY